MESSVIKRWLDKRLISAPDTTLTQLVQAAYVGSKAMTWHAMRVNVTRNRI
jgi:hypothetical protein